MNQHCHGLEQHAYSINLLKILYVCNMECTYHQLSISCADMRIDADLKKSTIEHYVAYYTCARGATACAVQIS